MSLQYELWLSDDAGRRLKLLKEFSFLTYTRAVSSLGTCNFGLPFRPFADEFNPWFKPDWRLEIWRRPQSGSSLRLENVFMLRKPNVYTRAEDNMQIIQFYGRDGIDLLNRRHVIQRGGTEWTTKSNYADDMIKQIVREQMLYGSAVDEDGTADNSRAWPQNEFFVQSDSSQGPIIEKTFEGQSVFEVLKDIKASTFQLNEKDAANRRIFFHVEPYYLSSVNTGSGAPVGWRLFTKADFYGADRTKGIEFSLENENIQTPRYGISHLDEFNAVYVKGNGRGASQAIESVLDVTRINSSRWNRVEAIEPAGGETTTAGLQNVGYAALNVGKPQRELPLEFISTPATRDTPRSLYGIDWDLGDRLPVNYADLQFEVDVNVVYVSLNESGEETITGRNEVLA